MQGSYTNISIDYPQELLPLIMCAIERHPDSSTRDSLTHTLFNLIKRPDEQQRRIIMDVGTINLWSDIAIQFAEGAESF